MAEKLLKKLSRKLERITSRKECTHDGEVGHYCGKCGADLRVVAGYECMLCSLMGRTTIYPTDAIPSFCRKCGAPRLTFMKARKRKSSKNKKD